MNPAYLVQLRIAREGALCFTLFPFIGLNTVYAYMNDGQSEFMDRRTFHLAMVYYAIVRISRFHHELTRFER